MVNKNPFLVICLSLLSFLLQAQNSGLRWGFQSGNTIGFIPLPDHDLVQSDWFLGNSIGVTSRINLGQFKFRWASFSGRPNLLLDLGIIHAHRGYGYQITGQSWPKGYNYLVVPVLLIIKPEQRYFYRKWRKNKIFWNTKVGLQFNHHPALKHARRLVQMATNAEGTESAIQLRSLSMQFVGGLGLEKTNAKGGMGYFGISFHSGLANILQSSILPDKSRPDEQVGLIWRGSHFSLDLQYYPGKWPRLTNRKPRIIHNPRHL